MSNPEEPVLKRRSFLGVAAGGVAAVAAPALLRANRLTSGAPSTGPTPADWNALAHDLSGTLVRPGDASYSVAHRLFDPRFDVVKPPGIAYCDNPRDVATCLAFVRKFTLPVTARCGGHSYAGYSTGSGLVIDVTRMSGLRMSGTTATVGAGTKLIDFYHSLAARNRAIPGGSCPTVGISGLTLGGGIGVTARAYGLTCDRLEQVEIVTANGAILTANAKEHPDLYWACRGGGGGNFGVVTSFTFSTVPAPSPVLFFFTYDWSQAHAVITAWQSWAPNAPDAMWSNLHAAAAPGVNGSMTIRVGGCYVGSDGITGAANVLDELYAKIGRPPGYFLNQYSYQDAMLIEANCAPSPGGYTACHLPWQSPGGQLSRAPQYAKSDYFTKPLSSHGISTLLYNIEKLVNVPGAQNGVGGIAFDALGGAVNRVKPAATAFVHRNALFGAQYTTDWTWGSPAAGVSNQHAWLRQFWQAMRPYASGQAYQNYIDTDLTNWEQAYYGANYPRLQQVKKTYDPTRVFHFPQAIRPA